MKHILTIIQNNKFFTVILLFKIIIIFVFSSDFNVKLFVPFINFFVSSGFSDPYKYFIENNIYEAFPYPAGMLIILSIPRVILSPFISARIFDVGIANIIALKIPILIADFFLYYYLKKIFKNNKKKVNYIYWASPIVIYVSYIHGQLDLIPIFFCFAAIYYIAYENKKFLSIFLFAIGLLCKWHLILILPFLLIYLYRNNLSIRKMFFYFIFISTVFILPVLFFNIDSFIKMVISTKQQSNFFIASFNLGQNLIIYITPAVIFFVFLKFFSYKKLNKEIFILFCGIAFGVTVSFSPSPPGWYIWPLPFIVYFFIKEKDFSPIYIYALSGLFIIYFIINDYSPILRSFYLFDKNLLFEPGLLTKIGLNNDEIAIINNTIFTLIQTVLISITFFMYKIGIKNNEYYKMKYSPVMIGISGDSGTGKHTIADDIKKFIGNDKVIQINGDDYHKWERGNKNYSYFTHLNPLSNELSKQSEHAFLLKEGKSVFKVEYDHNNGLFTNEKIIDPKNFVIFVGLHSFFHKKMRDILDLKIFLIPDETLRRHWKIIRDMKKRGYSKEKVIENIGARMCDFEKAILPQKEYADCIIEYFPVKDIKELGDGNEKIEIGVKYYVRNDISDIEKLYFEFTEFESIDVELIHVSNEKQILKFIGDISSEVLSKVAQKFVPNIEDLLETNNISWEAGIKGLNQLVFLLLIKDLMVVKKEI